MAPSVALDDAAWTSPWRRVRVGEKLLLGGALLLTALLAPPWPAAPLVAGAAVVATVGFARVPPRVLALGLAAPLAFIVLGAVTVAVRVGAAAPEAWIVLGPLSVDAASAMLAGQTLGRSVAGTLAVLLIATTTPMVDLLGWLAERGVPGPLVEMASLVYRLLFVLLGTALALVAAQHARLGDAAPVARRVANAGTAMGALVVRSWDRAARLSAGLDARGLDADLRTLPVARAASPRFVAATLGVVAGIWAAALVPGLTGHLGAGAG